MKAKNLQTLVEEVIESLPVPEDDQKALERQVIEMSRCNNYTWVRKLVSEGLMRSYPETVLCKRIRDGFHNKVQNLEFTSKHKFDNDFPIVGFAVDAKSSPMSNDVYLKRDLGMMGWHICRPIETYEFDFGTDDAKNEPLSEYNICRKPGKQKARVIWVSATFPIVNERVESFTQKVLSEFPMFYHVSLDRLRARISSADVENGLIPQESEFGDFLYPPRNYIFSSKMAVLEWIRELLSGTIRNLVDMRNARRIGNDIQRNGGDRMNAKVAAPEYQKESEFPLAVYQVDLRKMVEDGHPLRLYRDNNWRDQPDAFFTMDHIPGEYLQDVTDEFARKSI